MPTLLPQCCSPSLLLPTTVHLLIKSKLKWPSRCSFSAICVIFEFMSQCPACFPVFYYKRPKFSPQARAGTSSSTEVTCCKFLYFLKLQLVVTMAASEKKEELEVRFKEKEQVITAIYKLNLHCKECARAIEKPIIRTQGVQNVDIDVESGKVTVKGIFDAKKMHDLIEKKSKKKVEWISPKPKEEVKKEEQIEKIQKKYQEVIKTTVIKLHLHCTKCEDDLENKLLKLRGVHSVKTNRGDQTCAIVGTVEEEKLIKYIRKKSGKRGEIVLQKKEKRAEVMGIKEVEGEKKEELKNKDVGVPYFVHYTRAPQWFSDEDPNSCTVM